MQGMGDIIGIDAEFVALEMEKASLLQDGTRVVSKEGRQALARLSIIDHRTGKSLIPFCGQLRSEAVDTILHCCP